MPSERHAHRERAEASLRDAPRRPARIGRRPITEGSSGQPARRAHSTPPHSRMTCQLRCPGGVLHGLFPKTMRGVSGSTPCRSTHRSLEPKMHGGLSAVTMTSSGRGCWDRIYGKQTCWPTPKVLKSRRFVEIKEIDRRATSNCDEPPPRVGSPYLGRRRASWFTDQAGGPVPWNLNNNQCCRCVSCLRTASATSRLAGS